MITLHNQTTRYTVQPANAQSYRNIIDSGKLPSGNKVSPSHEVKRRHYPVYGSQMTTGDYIKAYERLNDHLKLFSLDITPEVDRVPPTLDATYPEVVEEIDPDYVPPVKAARKPSAVKQLEETKSAIHKALCALALADIAKAEKILNEVL